MTTATYRYENNQGRESIVVTGQLTRTVASAHPNFRQIRDYCQAQHDAGQPIDAEHVFGLINIGKTVEDKLLTVTSRVRYAHGKLYFDGDEVDDSLAKHIIRMIREGDNNYEAYGLFLENLAANPSEASRKALFEFVAGRDFTITDDGDFVAYKGVTAELKSKYAGRATVTAPDGTVTEIEHDYVPNAIGSTVEVPRSYVAADRNVACSTGLHVGTRSYAADYGRGGAMLIVAVNPRDVVMVPSDHDGQKMRVCRYRVLDTNEVELTQTTYDTGKHRLVKDVDGDEPNDDEDECDGCGSEYSDECPECGDYSY